MSHIVSYKTGNPSSMNILAAMLEFLAAEKMPAGLGPGGPGLGFPGCR